MWLILKVLHDPSQAQENAEIMKVDRQSPMAEHVELATKLPETDHEEKAETKVVANAETSAQTMKHREW